MRQYTYFISDLHLGATYLKNPLDYERRVVSWLKSIKDDAKSLYLMGDILDYWYEYRTVVPRGFTRFFGTIAELADSGVEITWFIGNHDIWIFDYLPQELGIRIVDGSEIVEIEGATIIYRANKIIISNPRPVTDEIALEFYKKSDISEIAYYKALGSVAIMNYKETALAIFKDKVNKDNIDIVLNEWNNFIDRPDRKDCNETVKMIEKLLNKLKKDNKNGRTEKITFNISRLSRRREVQPQEAG